MIGKNFWDYLGGPDTYEDLLKIYEKVGRKTVMRLFKNIR